MRYHPVSPEHQGLVVAVGKPGKEAAGYGRPNPNDMLPSVLQDGVPLSFLASFYDIFREFQHLGVAHEGRAPEVVLELVGALLFRSAFMLDHRNVGDGWRWSPPESVMDILESASPFVAEPPLPIRVYLFLVEALALNEDVARVPRTARCTAAQADRTPCLPAPMSWWCSTVCPFTRSSAA